MMKTRDWDAFRVTAGKVAMMVAGLMLTGCQGMKEAAGTYEAYLQGTPQQVVGAAKTALDDMDMKFVTHAATSMDGSVSAKTAQNKQIDIKVTKAGDNVSKMSVRVGVLGDQSISDAVIRETKERL
jgi:ABC-type glycerol-3-phosphate transport system substrate-binding protein